MGDPLDLEERLEQLAPRGLTDRARTRLEDQIDELAAGAEEKADLRSGSRRWRWAIGMAATVALMAALVILSVGRGGTRDGTTGVENPPATVPVTAPLNEMATWLEPMELDRAVAERRSGGYVLSSTDQPMYAWNYNVRDVELVLDPESGLEVEIVEEREEMILTPVKSF